MTALDNLSVGPHRLPGSHCDKESRDDILLTTTTAAIDSGRLVLRGLAQLLAESRK